MTFFELCYLVGERTLPVLYGTVRRRLLELTEAASEAELQVLDVGGRKSHYTVGLPAQVTITELPRITELQHSLNLGVNDEIIKATMRRRSNIREIIIDDMTRCKLADRSYDIVVAVEVLEHVEEDRQFLEHVGRVLRPGGWFLMTTPNGDYLSEPTHPDHKRHYQRQQLHSLLNGYFCEVTVRYIGIGGMWRRLGLRGLSLRQPARSLLSMTANLINSVQSARASVAGQATGTHHLLASGRKKR